MSRRSAVSILISVLFLPQPIFAFNTPLSEEAVREAYFLGQRHDGTFLRLLQQHVKLLPPPSTGPHISSVAFLTPFIQLVQFSDGYLGNYSAQQAWLDHKGRQETMEIVVEILFTPTYGDMLPVPAGSKSDRTSLNYRQYDFWRDFQVQVTQGAEDLTPSNFDGQSKYSCSRRGCTRIGATLRLTFPAEQFTSDPAIIRITPPEGPEVIAEFDLARLR